MPCRKFAFSAIIRFSVFFRKTCAKQPAVVALSYFNFRVPRRFQKYLTLHYIGIFCRVHFALRGAEFRSSGNSSCIPTSGRGVAPPFVVFFFFLSRDESDRRKHRRLVRKYFQAPRLSDVKLRFLFAARPYKRAP